MSINSQLGGIKKEVHEIKSHSNSNPTTKNPPADGSNAIFKLLELIIYPLVLFYVFMRLGIPGVDLIGNFLTGALSFLKVESVLGIMSGEAYLALIVLILLFMIYIDIFILVPFTYIFSIRTDPSEKIFKEFKIESLIIVILLLPLFISVSLSAVSGDDGSIDDDMDKFNIDTKSKIKSLMDGPLCVLFNDATTCMKNDETEHAKQSVRSEYDIYFKKPEYNYVDNLERFRNRPYYLNYEILAKGKPLYIDRIECYANKINSENLLSNISFEDKEILNNKRLPVSDIKCNVEDLEIDGKVDEDFKLVTLLYYSIESEYTQPVHVINVDKYIENNYASREGLNIVEIEEEIRNSLDNNKPIKSNNFINFKVYTSPRLPYFVGEDYVNEDGYYFSFTFEKEDLLGDNIVSNKFVNYQIPEIMDIVCNDGYDCNQNLDNLISTYDDKSNIELNLKLNNQDFDREEFVDSIQFNIKTKLRKKSITPLVINNPSYEEDEEGGEDSSIEELETDTQSEDITT
jgi:hypothetical protein